MKNCDIAVIGMSGRFPGATSVEKYWKNIESGSECITHFTKQQLLELSISEEVLNQTNFVKAAGIMQGPLVDLSRFKFDSSEINVVDHRLGLLLDACDDALKDSKVKFDVTNNSVGVFVGTSVNKNKPTNIIQGKEEVARRDKQNSFLTDEEYFSNQISYRLGLTGPSMVILSACASSLASVYVACRALQSGDCDMALAGAVNANPKMGGYIFSPDLLYSPDGYCRVFDHKSSGTVPGNGVGIIVLKPLDRAIADNDTIYSVIKGAYMNNDGDGKIGFNAPSISGIAQAVSSAIKMSSINKDDITFVEAHGTGTVFGDALEVSGLSAAFDTTRRNYCAIGSVKANIGYLDVASGISSLIKSILCIYHRTLAPQINYELSNPYIQFSETPFFVNTEAIRFNGDKKMIGIVNSMGDGGSNVHIVLESPPC